MPRPHPMPGYTFPKGGCEEEGMKGPRCLVDALILFVPFLTCWSKRPCREASHDGFSPIRETGTIVTGRQPHKRTVSLMGADL